MKLRILEALLAVGLILGIGATNALPVFAETGGGDAACALLPEENLQIKNFKVGGTTYIEERMAK